jgi:hypothetical protein
MVEGESAFSTADNSVRDSLPFMKKFEILKILKMSLPFTGGAVSSANFANDNSATSLLDGRFPKLERALNTLGHEHE